MANFDVSFVYLAQDKFSAPLKNINRTLKANTNAFKRSSAAATKFGKKLQSIGKAAFVKLTLPITAIAGLLIKASSDAEEVQNKFSVVFRSVSKDAEKTAANLAKNFGLSKRAAKELLAGTGDLLSGFGFTDEAALKFSTKVQELAVDLASFTNVSGGAKQASEALTKALLGERESIKTLGISIREVDIKAELERVGAADLTGISKRQAVAAATLNLAIAQSGKAIGDFARSRQSFANQMRIFRGELDDTAVVFGNILLPKAAKFLKFLIKLTDKLQGLTPETKKWVLILGGVAAVLPIVVIALGALAFAVGALLTPVGIVIAILAALVIGVGFVIFKFDEIVRFFKKVAAPVFDFFGKIATRVKEDFIAMGDGIKSVFLSMKSFIVPIIDAIMAPINDLINTVSNAVGFLGNLAGKVASFLGFGEAVKIPTTAQGGALIPPLPFSRAPATEIGTPSLITRFSQGGGQGFRSTAELNVNIIDKNKNVGNITSKQNGFDKFNVGRNLAPIFGG